MNRFLKISLLAIVSSTLLVSCDEDSGDTSSPGNQSTDNLCPASQSYYLNACVNNSDLCDNKLCGDDETCIDKHCLPNDLLCGNKLCMGEETCRDGECVNLNKQCGDIYCSAVETCFKNKCEPTRLICGESLCKETEICENNACKKNTDLCGEEICKTGEKCLDGQCADESKKCGKGYCRIDETCQNNYCINSTSLSQLECAKDEIFVEGKCRTEDELCNKVLCDKSQICVKAQCVNPNMLCGNTLCNHGETCIDAHCVNDLAVCGGKVCSDTQTCQNGECVEDQCGEMKYKVGDIIQFGHFEQDRVVKASDRDDAEDIEWEVLEIQGCRMLLLSKMVLQKGKGTEYIARINTTQYAPQGLASESYTWSRSVARAWLNGYDETYQYLYFNETGNLYTTPYNSYMQGGTMHYSLDSTMTANQFKFEDYTNNNFIDIAFTPEEKAQIVITKQIDDSTEHPCDTYDRVFLLSRTEVEKYFPDIHKEAWKPANPYSDIVCQASLYVAQGSTNGSYMNSKWQLRTMGSQEECKQLSGSGGSSEGAHSPYVTITEYGAMHCLSAYLGNIRPAMWVKLKD